MGQYFQNILYFFFNIHNELIISQPNQLTELFVLLDSAPKLLPDLPLRTINTLHVSMIEGTITDDN